MTATTEHQLPAARAKLRDAISDLIDPQAETIDGEIVYIDSLYDQLIEAVPGQFLGRTNGAARSQPPLWIDAADLLTTIDRTVRTWQPTIPDRITTITRLGRIQQHRWRPQDTQLITDYTRQLDDWTNRITTLFTETHIKHLPAACPACNKKTVYRRDNAGELVRKPALQITTLGCQCQACKTVWGPELFMHLARVLGYQLPAGVLE